jgi:hypothetical protein
MLRPVLRSVLPLRSLAAGALAAVLAACSPTSTQVAPASPPAAAAAPAAPARAPAVQYKKKTAYNFEDDTIEGELVKPDSNHLGARRTSGSPDPSGGSRAQLQRPREELGRKKEQVQQKAPPTSPIEPGEVTFQPETRSRGGGAPPHDPRELPEQEAEGTVRRI